tara:strand:+ start:190 stop:567 length:378 start_codon:yes stop_codon:yes gene_type:complete
MSDTPRTDAVTKKSVDEDDGEYLTEDLLFHARELEREIRQLEVAIYDLRTENNLLHEALDQVIDDRDAYHDENAKLINETDELFEDKERLDFILKNCTIEYDRFYRTYFDNRDEIDEVMQMEELI